MASSDTNFGLGPRLGVAWSPMGMTAPLDRKDAKRPWSFFRIGALLVLGILTAMQVLTDHPSLPILIAALALPILGAIVDEYRKCCWQIQRLRDIGAAPSVIAKKRWPVWIGLTTTLFIILAAIVFERQYDADFLTDTQFMLLFMALVIALPISVLIVSHLYWKQVIKPFNEFLSEKSGS